MPIWHLFYSPFQQGDRQLNFCDKSISNVSAQFVAQALTSFPRQQMLLKTFLPGLQTSVFSIVAQSWADIPDGLSEGATVVHDGQRVGEGVEGGKEEGKAHPSGENTLKVVNMQCLYVLEGGSKLSLYLMETFFGTAR